MKGSLTLNDFGKSIARANSCLDCLGDKSKGGGMFLIVDNNTTNAHVFLRTEGAKKNAFAIHIARMMCQNDELLKLITRAMEHYGKLKGKNIHYSSKTHINTR